MSQTFEFYDARAIEAADQAKDANLQNVKERFLHAEKTWRRLADQARRVMADRKNAERERASRREADEQPDAVI